MNKSVYAIINAFFQVRASLNYYVYDFININYNNQIIKSSFLENENNKCISNKNKIKNYVKNNPKSNKTRKELETILHM